MIESFRGDLGEKLCYVAQHENPVRSYPTPGERQIASFRGATSDRGCFGLETGSVIPDEEKYLNLMRALREADE